MSLSAKHQIDCNFFLGSHHQLFFFTTTTAADGLHIHGTAFFSHAMLAVCVHCVPSGTTTFFSTGTFFFQVTKTTFHKYKSLGVTPELFFPHVHLFFFFFHTTFFSLSTPVPSFFRSLSGRAKLLFLTYAHHPWKKTGNNVLSTWKRTRKPDKYPLTLSTPPSGLVRLLRKVHEATLRFPRLLQYTMLRVLSWSS